MKASFTDTESYINNFPDDVQAILQQLRSAIKEAAPEAQEKPYEVSSFCPETN